MGTQALLSAIAREAKPPCDRYHCHERARCAKDELACESFVVYVYTGKAYAPEAQFDSPFEPGAKPIGYFGSGCGSKHLYDALQRHQGDESGEKKLERAEDVIAEGILNRTDLDMAWSSNGGA